MQSSQTCLRAGSFDEIPVSEQKYLQYFPGVSAYINTYEPNLSALKMAAGAIFGQEEVNGKLPITVPKL